MERDTNYSPARGRSGWQKQVEKIQHKKTQRKHTVPYTALYHIMHEQGALVAPRLWADEGVGRAKMNKRESRQSCASDSGVITRTLARHRARGRGRQD